MLGYCQCEEMLRDMQYELLNIYVLCFSHVRGGSSLLEATRSFVAVDFKCSM